MPTLFIDYLPATLHENKDWYISYYVKNPATQKLKRKRIKLNRIKSKIQRRRYSKKLILEINKKLENGWNPFIEQSAPKAYTNIFDIYKIWLDVKKKELRDDSMRVYKSFVTIITNFLKKKSNTDVYYVINFDKRTAVDFMNYLYNIRNVSGRTYNSYLSYANTLFNWMLENSYVNNNPFQGIRKKKETTKKRVLIPIEDRKKIKKYLLKNDKYFLATLMLEYYALLRPKEILNLEIKNFMFEISLIYVPAKVSKNGKERLITISDALLPYLTVLNLDLHDKSLIAFSQNLRPGKKIKRTKYMGYRWSNMRKILNFPDTYHMYSLRDSGIVQMLQDGISIDEVAKQADNSSLEMTSKYALHANKKASEQILKKSSEI